LTQGDLEKTQGSSEKNNYNEPYGEWFYTSANTFTKATNGETARHFPNQNVSKRSDLISRFLFAVGL